MPMSQNLRLQAMLQQKMMAQKFSPQPRSGDHSPMRVGSLGNTPPRVRPGYPRQRNMSEQSNESFQSSSSSERMAQQSIAEFNLERAGLIPPRQGRYMEESPRHPPEFPPLQPDMQAMPRFPPHLPPHLQAGDLPEGFPFMPPIDPYMMRGLPPAAFFGAAGDMGLYGMPGPHHFFPGMNPFFPGFKPPRYLILHFIKVCYNIVVVRKVFICVQYVYGDKKGSFTNL